MGDPSGIGPEVLLKSLASLRRAVQGRSFPLTVIGDLSFLKKLAYRLNLTIPWEKIHWIDVPLKEKICPGRVQPSAGRAAYACLQEAVRRLRAGQADALVTAPVSKEAIVRAGIRWQGHTEYLADQFHRRTTMLLVTGRFRAGLVTTHAAIRDLPARLKKAAVVHTLRQVREALTRDFGVKRPRIGLAALNPHGGEGGLFGGEEKKILLPAVRTVRAAESDHPELVEGYRIDGPLPVDSLIHAAAQGRYDALVCIYHDQALIPLKLLGWNRAVNVTLGLPFIRTSPVHGTAFDIAGRGKADAGSMRSALELAVKLVRRRTHGA